MVALYITLLKERQGQWISQKVSAKVMLMINTRSYITQTIFFLFPLTLQPVNSDHV